MDEAMSIFKEFSCIICQYKAIETSKDTNKTYYIYTSAVIILQMKIFTFGGMDYYTIVILYRNTSNFGPKNQLCFMKPFPEKLFSHMQLN